MRTVMVFDASRSRAIYSSIMKRWSFASSVRARQSLLGAALALPLVVAIAAAPPFSAEPRAQATSRMIGPAFPIMLGSESVVPTRSGNTISYTTSFTCGDDADNVFTLSNPDGSGRYRTVSRQLGGLEQTLTVTAFAGGVPSEFIHEESAGTTTNTTTVTMVDDNGDGNYEAVRLSGLSNVTLSFVYNGDSVSFPWSQASAIGLNTDSCAGTMPQAWIPLADTNGDGNGDALVFDLDGNGVADADMFAGPSMAVMAVPAMGPIARLIMMALMGLAGSWYLSRRPGDISGTPA